MLGTMGRKVQQTAAKTDCESTGEDFAQHLSNDLGNSDNGLGLLDDRKFVGRGLGACMFIAFLGAFAVFSANLSSLCSIVVQSGIQIPMYKFIKPLLENTLSAMPI